MQVCTLALELEVPGSWGYVTRFLTSDKLAPLAGPELARLSRHPQARIAEKAWEILQAIHRAGRPRLCLKTLGSFQVWRGANPLPDREWEGPLSRLLLKALIARGGQGVSKEVIMEDLWPEAAPAKAESKFKSCLHRLRKALEPDLYRTVGSSYVHLEANLLSLDKELVRVDVDDLAAFAAAGKKLEAAGEVKEALASYQEAADLYAGDFLPEELYHPWVERQREAFRGLYLEVLERQAELWEKQGSPRRAARCWQQAHRTDPLEPRAVQRLMLLNDRLGRPQMALRVFKEYREALKRELDASPDDTTTAIYRKIKEKS
ncbi:MAG: winged helix-turn-helix domain-containing protein [Desulfomonile tiedjei]|nr:winged helix-turn-helix domain-containing protein [Desulfomonile tiedjei]